MADYSAALKILEKIDEEKRNWDSGRQQAGELFRAAKQADAVVRTAEQRVAQLTEDCARLQAEKTRHEEAVRTVLDQLNTIKPRLAEQERAKAEVLAALDIQIQARQAALDKLTADLNDLKARHSL